MNAHRFGYYDGWPGMSLECGSCGWEGAGEATVAGNFRNSTCQAERKCPRCGRVLGLVYVPMFPTAKADWGRMVRRHQLEGTLGDCGGRSAERAA